MRFRRCQFSSSMSNISFFYPKSKQGMALGLNAGLGNLGVSVLQFVVPVIIGFSLFGALAGDGQVTESGKVFIFTKCCFCLGYSNCYYDCTCMVWNE